MTSHQGAFGARLEAALDARGSACIGIDPHSSVLESWGLPDTADGLARFADSCIEAFADSTAIVKPQSAFFERFGSAGIAVLERVIAAMRAAGALVLLDVKRGDIGSTMAAYADAYLDAGSTLASDAITVSPYLGVGSLQPAFDTALRHGAGVFVLSMTSNIEGPDVQSARRASGETVGQYVLKELAERNAEAAAAGGGAPCLGSLGAVVGATIEAPGIDFSSMNGPILAPGVGTQGGSPDTVRRIFGDALAAVVPSVSREALSAGPDPRRLRAAAARLNEQFAFLRA